VSLQLCKSAVCKSAVCMCRTPKGNRPFRPRFTYDFQISHVICQIHLPYTGYFCPEVLLCKSSNEKRSEICIREQFVTQMVRYRGEIENGVLIRERTQMLDFFGMYLLLRYKAIGLLKNFGKKCQNLRFTVNK